MTEEELEQERQYNFELGISSGLERAANLLLDKATEDFRRGRDEFATARRKDAGELQKMASDCHPRKSKT